RAAVGGVAGRRGRDEGEGGADDAQAVLGGVGDEALGIFGAAGVVVEVAALGHGAQEGGERQRLGADRVEVGGRALFGAGALGGRGRLGPAGRGGGGQGQREASQSAARSARGRARARGG